MGEITGIQWCHHTFNPWIGCTRVGPGCDYCYAERFGHRHGIEWGPGKPRHLAADSTWAQPLAWNRKAARDGVRRRVFCASLADVFDPEAPQGARERLWTLIEATTRLDWLLLTKRVGNARRMLPLEWVEKGCPPTVCVGATVVTQEEADRDVGKLLAIKACVLFLSIEPMLGPIILPKDFLALGPKAWVIAGGESGPRARPAHPDWFRSLRDQCAAAGVPFFVKQLSGAAGKPIKDLELFPRDLQIREFPHA